MKVKYGLRNVHVAKLIEDTKTGKITYDTPFKLPGAVSLSREPKGDETEFKADDGVFFVASNNEGYTGDLELSLIAEKFLKDILGNTTDSNGAIFENSDDILSRFALMFEVQGDVKARRNIYYDCSCGRPSTEDKTTEGTKDPNTEKLALKMNPRTTDRMVRAYLEPTEENIEKYNKFFESVYEKVA